MAGIFNVFGDSSKVKTPTVFGAGSTNANSMHKLKTIGAPGSTPAKIFGQKSKGLTIRSSSDLNICFPAPRPFDIKKDTTQAEKCTLKPFEIFGKSISPVKQKSPLKQKSPIKLKSPQKEFKPLSPVLVVKSNQDIQNSEKSKEFVFKKPDIPEKYKKLDMEYPEPENLAPICDMEIEMFDLTNQNLLKLFKNTYFCADEDEGFSSDNEPLPIVQVEIQTNESCPQNMEVPLPDLEQKFSCLEESSN